jgi:hypothetical protein
MSNFGFRALVEAHSLPERSGSLVKTDHIRESLSEVRADRPHDKFIQVHFSNAKPPLALAGATIP